MTMSSMVSRLLSLAFAGLVVGIVPAAAQPLPCGMDSKDWCPAPAGDPCGRHRSADACRANPVCYGMPYRGESAIACILDERGFASNCPTVGCTISPPPRK